MAQGRDFIGAEGDLRPTEFVSFAYFALLNDPCGIVCDLG